MMPRPIMPGDSPIIEVLYRYSYVLLAIIIFFFVLLWYDTESKRIVFLEVIIVRPGIQVRERINGAG